MEQLIEIATRFINRSRDGATYWEAIPEAFELFDFIYNGGVWVKNYGEQIKTIQAKKIHDLSLDEVYTYLTALAAKERVWGTFGYAISEGTMDKLLTRFLELAKKN